MVDTQRLRSVISAYPTGVSVVTARTPGGEQYALVVGSFSSISLEPPLVGFFPALTSSTWPKIAVVGSFCVNVLSASQRDICHLMSANTQDKYAGVSHRHSPLGHPILDGSEAWIECIVERTEVIGDHFLVVGAVQDFDCVEAGSALVFHRRKYHGTSASSFV